MDTAESQPTNLNPAITRHVVGLTDIRHPRARALWIHSHMLVLAVPAILVFSACLFVFTGSMKTPTGWLTGMAVTVLCSAPFALTFRLWQRLNLRSFQRRFDAISDPVDFLNGLEAWIGSEGMLILSPMSAVTTAASLADRCGMRGLAVRFSPTTQPVPAPIDTPFEPRLLSEHDETVKAASNQGGTSDEATLKAWWRRVKAAQPLPPALFTGALIINLFVCVLCLSRLVGGSSFTISDWWLLTALPFGIYYTLRGRSPYPSWHCVPGGILVHRNWCNWRERRRTDLFARSDSALALCDLRNQRGWSAAVRRGTRCSITQLTPLEGDFLLRAWLSPLPTPTLEQMSDFH